MILGKKIDFATGIITKKMITVLLFWMKWKYNIFRKLKNNVYSLKMIAVNNRMWTILKILAIAIFQFNQKYQLVWELSFKKEITTYKNSGQLAVFKSDKIISLTYLCFKAF